MIGSDAPFVGRVDERIRLETLLVRLLKGLGGAYLVSGEAGLGKSRLVAEAIAEHKMHGSLIAVSTASEYAPAPYAAIRDLLRTCDARLPKVLIRDPGLRERLRPVEELADSGRGAEDPQAARRRTLDAIVSAFEAYAAAMPVILVVEDVQWIDAASADALMHLTLGCEDRRLALLFTLRDDTAVAPATRDWTERLERRGMRRLVLAPLTINETLALIESCVEGDILDISTKRMIAELSAGNPLHTIALVEHVADNPRELEQSLPSSLESTVRRRLSAFTSEQRALLRVAALCATFDEALLLEVTRQSRVMLRETLRFARDRGVIIEKQHDGFVFRHALFERAFCDELMPDERIDYHASIALALEHMNVVAPARLAHHLYESGDRIRATYYFERAAEDAYTSFAYTDAVRYFERAFADSKPEIAKVDLWERFAQAAEMAANLPARILAYSRLREWADEYHDRSRAIRYRIELARARYAATEDLVALSDCRRAVDLAADDTDDTTVFSALALYAWLLVHQKHLDEARVVLERARALEHAGDARARAWLYEALAAYDVHSGTLLHWREHCDAMLAVAVEVSQTFLAGRLGSAASLAMSSLVDDYEYALRCAERSLELGKSEGAFYPMHLSSAAFLAYILGDLKRVQGYLEKTLMSRDDDIGIAVSNARVGILVGLRIGDEVLVRRSLRDDLLDRAFASKSSVTFGPIAAATAEYLWLSGRRAEASMLVERTVARLTDPTQNLNLLVQAAQMEIGTKARALARAMLLSLSAKSRSATTALHLHDAFAVTGEARRICARRAAAGFSALGWRLWEAVALEVADDLAPARTIYIDCGAIADVKRLSRIGTQANSFALLTRREAQVAELLSAGQTNRAIAQKLVLTEKTVEHHVTAILTKLGVKSRAEAIAKFARELHATIAKTVGEP